VTLWLWGKCRGGGYGGYHRSPVSTFINFSDLFYYWGPGYGRRRDMIVRQPEEMTFFESIFSFGAPLQHPQEPPYVMCISCSTGLA
jgi:hypothetical protein